VYRQSAWHEAQHLRRRGIVVIEARANEVSVCDVDLKPQVEVAALLAHEPRLATEPSHEVSHDRFFVIDREERVPGRPHQLAVGL
jgi:hypothetical protein